MEAALELLKKTIDLQNANESPRSHNREKRLYQIEEKQFLRRPPGSMQLAGNQHYRGDNGFARKWLSSSLGPRL